MNQAVAVTPEPSRKCATLPERVASATWRERRLASEQHRRPRPDDAAVAVSLEPSREMPHPRGRERATIEWSGEETIVSRYTNRVTSSESVALSAPLPEREFWVGLSPHRECRDIPRGRRSAQEGWARHCLFPEGTGGRQRAMGVSPRQCWLFPRPLSQIPTAIGASIGRNCEL